MKHLALALALVLMLFGTAGAWAADSPATISTQDEFSEFMQGYYKHPRPELVDDAMRFVAGAGASLMTNDDTSRMLQTSFACLYQRHPDKREGWKKTIASLPEPAQKYFRVPMESDLNAMFQATPTVPTKNDMSWGCFFVTGDASYVQDVILAMKHLDERKDLNKFLTGASAQWSLAGLSKDNDEIRTALEAAAKGSDKQLAAAANEALKKSPEEMRASTLEIMRAQKKAGVW